jgi:drug/metabolite transporter (DMT)-like permease
VSRTAAHAPLARSYWVGALLALFAGTMWSFGGITVRFAPNADPWQYLVWRSIGLFVAVEAWNVLQGRGLLIRHFVTGGWLGFAAASALSLAAITFIFALKETSIANALFLASISPLLSMVLARFILGERMTPASVVAIALGVAGLAVMVSGVGDAESSRSSWIGNLGALASSLCFALYSICVRLAPGKDFSPTLPGLALVSFVVCVAVTLAQGKTLVPPRQDILMAMLHGAVFIGIGVACFNAAASQIPATGLTVLAQTETLLSPVWAFLILGEVPSGATLTGGALILTGVLVSALAGARQARPKAEPVTSPPSPV